MDGNLSAVLVAFVASVPATFAALSARRTHKEVQTNHGLRQGVRIENLTTDVLWLRENVVTKAEMDRHTSEDHAFQDEVRPYLKKEN